MNRKEFFKRTLGVAIAAIGLSKVAKAEDRHVFNVKLLRERIEHLKRNPPMILIPDSIEESDTTMVLIFKNGLPCDLHPANELMDDLMNPYFVRSIDRLASPVVRVSLIPFEMKTKKGNQFVVRRNRQPEGTI